MPEQRIERRLTGETVPVEAGYMTTQWEEVDGEQQVAHYFRVPVPSDPRPQNAGFTRQVDLPGAPMPRVSQVTG